MIAIKPAAAQRLAIQGEKSGETAFDSALTGGRRE
jgi:hypothetical protein